MTYNLTPILIPYVKEGMLNLIDETRYGVHSPLTYSLRDDMGIMIFYGTGVSWSAYTYNDTNPGRLNIKGEWQLLIDSEDMVEAVGFWCHKWDVLKIYAIDNVVFHEDKFYHCTEETRPGEEPGVVANWEETVLYSDFADAYQETEKLNFVDHEEVYMIHEASYVNSEQISGGNGADFSIVKTSCYNYTISLSDTIAGYDGYKIYLYSQVDGTLIFSGSITNVTDDYLLDLDTYSYDDGIYKIILTPYNNDVDGNPVLESSLTSCFIIYEMCAINICVDTLIKNILCYEISPCCESCDLDVLEQRKIRRHELNKIMALYYDILMYIHGEQLEHYNLASSTDSEIAKVTMIANKFNKLQDVIARCGLCTTDTTEDFNCVS